MATQSNREIPAVEDPSALERKQKTSSFVLLSPRLIVSLQKIF